MASVEQATQLRTDVTNTLTQMRADFTAEIGKLKSELDRVSTVTLGEKIESAIAKIVQARIEILEQAVLKMQNDGTARSLREDSIIEKTSFGRPFVLKGETGQSFNDWAHKVSVYMFGIGTTQSAHI